MDKLYRIIVLHGAPKDSHTSTEEYIIAKNDEEVFNYLAKNYKDCEWIDEVFEEKEDEYTSKEELKQEIMENKGDLDSEEGWEDAYYGVTKFGWEFINEITDDEIKLLKKYKILAEVKDAE